MKCWWFLIGLIRNFITPDPHANYLCVTTTTVRPNIHSAFPIVLLTIYFDYVYVTYTYYNGFLGSKRSHPVRHDWTGVDSSGLRCSPRPGETLSGKLLDRRQGAETWPDLPRIGKQVPSNFVSSDQFYCNLHCFLISFSQFLYLLCKKLKICCIKTDSESRFLFQLEIIFVACSNF